MFDIGYLALDIARVHCINQMANVRYQIYKG